MEKDKIWNLGWYSDTEIVTFTKIFVLNFQIFLFQGIETGIY